MTREEALQILDTIPTIGEQVDALEMAIKALEQEPLEDCISRQAATTIPALPTEHRACPLNIDDAYEMGWFDCQDAINNLPSVVSSAEQSSMVEEWESSIPLETEMAQVFRKVFGVDDDVPVVIKYPDEGSEEE